jgi:hypothetical protein
VNFNSGCDPLETWENEGGLIVNKVELSAVSGGERSAGTDFEKLGENAATLVRGAFSVVNDLMEEFGKEGQESEGADAQSPDGEGRLVRLSRDYPVGVAVASGFAGFVIGAVAVGMMSRGMRKSGIHPIQSFQKFSQRVPRLMSRLAKRAA